MKLNMYNLLKKISTSNYENTKKTLFRRCLTSQLFRHPLVQFYTLYTWCTATIPDDLNVEVKRIALRHAFVYLSGFKPKRETVYPNHYSSSIFIGT